MKGINKMSYKITTSVETRRGCGFRKEGGLYFVSSSAMDPCGNLPIQLVVCPLCHAGIKFSRGFTWLDLDLLVRDKILHEALKCMNPYCNSCPANGSWGRKVGLIWIGEMYYPTPSRYINEVVQMGFSRRIKQVPKNFKLGEDVIALGHRKTIWKNGFPGCEKGEHGKFYPGIFLIFKPERIEYIIHQDGSDDPKKLQRLADRGIKLVKVKRINEDFLDINAEN
jgi:hypothetical protein